MHSVEKKRRIVEETLRPHASVARVAQGCLPEKRKQVRQARARPVLDALHTWWEANYGKLSRKSEMAQAIQYALGRWTALTRYSVAASCLSVG